MPIRDVNGGKAIAISAWYIKKDLLFITVRKSAMEIKDKTQIYAGDV